MVLHYLQPLFICQYSSITVLCIAFINYLILVFVKCIQILEANLLINSTVFVCTFHTFFRRSPFFLYLFHFLSIIVISCFEVFLCVCVFFVYIYSGVIKKWISFSKMAYLDFKKILVNFCFNRAFRGYKNEK